MKPSKKKPTPSKSAAKSAAKKQEAPSGHLKPMVLGLYGVIGMSLSVMSLTTVKLPFAETFAKEYWRHAIGALLLILGLAASLVGAAISMLDADVVKAQVVDYVKVHKHRDLSLQGDIELTFFPKLGLDCGKLTLSERNSSAKFASVENARLYLAWWPLLRRQLRIERIALDGVQANITRHKDGSTNFDDLLAADGRLAGVNFEIERVHVFDSEIHLRDAGSGLQFSFSDLDLETGHVMDDTPSEMKASFRLRSAREKLDTRVNLNAHLLFDRAADRFELSDIHAHAMGHSARVTGLDVDARGALTAYPGSQRYTLNKVSLSLQGQMDRHKLDSHVEVASLSLDKERFSGSTLSLQSRAVNASDTLAATLEIPAFELVDNRLQASSAQATLELDASGRKLQGQLSSPLSWHFKTRELHLPTLQTSVSVQHPSLSSRVLIKGSGEFKAGWAEQNAQLDFRATLDDSEFGGKLQLKDFAKPAYSFDVVVSALDLDRYLAVDWSRRLAADAEAFDFSALDKLKLRGRFHSSGDFRLAHLRTRELTAEVQIDDGTLRIPSLQAQLYGGSVQGSLKLETGRKPQLQLQQKLRDVQLDALLKDLSPGEPRLSGQGVLLLDVRAQASSPATLRKSLAGSASLALARGSLSGINLHEALLAGKPRLGLRGAQHSESSRETESTRFDELKASFDIDRGRARNPDLLLKSASFIAKGEGEAALESGELNYRVNTTVNAGLRRSSAGELAELGGITVPASLSANGEGSQLTLHLGEASGGRLAELARRNKARH